MALVTFDGMNAREQIEAVAAWLGYQNEGMSAGLKSPEDGFKLWRFMMNSASGSDMADDWTPEQRIAAIGYCPIENFQRNS